MEVAVEQTHLPGLLIVRPDLFQDERGFFTEVFRADKYSDAGLPTNFVQMNHSGSVRGTVRGLHFQWEPPMGKLMRVLKGEAFLVAVDIRLNSPTFGQWYGRTCKAEERVLIWGEAGFARGFAVLSEFAEIEYLTTGIYNSGGESGIRWDDPAIGVEWPVKDPILSNKDRVAQTLAEWREKPAAANFTFKG